MRGIEPRHQLGKLELGHWIEAESRPCEGREMTSSRRCVGAGLLG